MGRTSKLSTRIDADLDVVSVYLRMLPSLERRWASEPIDDEQRIARVEFARDWEEVIASLSLLDDNFCCGRMQERQRSAYGQLLRDLTQVEANIERLKLDPPPVAVAERARQIAATGAA